MAKKIPPYIVDDATRLRLARLAELDAEIMSHHKELSKMARAKTLTPELAAAWRKLIAAKNHLEKEWQRLVPNLTDIFTKRR